MDRKTDLLDTIKIYAGIAGGACIGVGCFLVLGMSEREESRTLLIRNITIGFFIVGACLFLLYFILRFLLKKRLKEAYKGFSYVAETFKRSTIGGPDVSKKRMREVRSDLKVTEGVLWKEMSEGVHHRYLFRALVLSVLEVLFFYGLWLMVRDRSLLGIVCGGLFVLISGYWLIMALKGVKRKPDGIVAFMDRYHVLYGELERDFQAAEACGTDVWLGKDYAYVYTAVGARIVRISDITACEIHRMSGWSIRRLFLPYYVLLLQTAEDTILKYGNSRQEFQKFEQLINEKRMAQGR